MEIDVDVCREIASHEAIVRQAYKDSENVWTWSIGITSSSGHPVEPYIDNPQPMQKCVDAYVDRLKIYAAQVLRAFGGYKLEKHQFTAALSFHWNTGKIHQATWVKDVLSGDMDDARANFMLWRKPSSIIPRRRKEMELFFDGVWSNNGTVSEITKLNSKHQPIFASAKQKNIDKEFKLALGSSGNIKAASKGIGNLEYDSIEDLVTSIDPEESLSTEKLLVSNPNHKSLPKYRPTRKGAVILATIEKFADLIPDKYKGDSVFVVGIRGYYTDSMGKEGANDRGIYDDAIFIVEPGKVYNFNGNTDPSYARTGIATLKAPQVVMYKPGMHGISGNNPYPAFRQAGICTVIRDKVGEDTDTEARRFWINLHRGGANKTSSLGCQTIPLHQWNEFKITLDRLLEEHGQEKFCYLLVEEKDVPTESEVLETARYRHSDTDKVRLPEEATDMNANLILLIRELLESKRSKPPAEPVVDNDAETRKILTALILKLAGGDSTTSEKKKEKELPIKNALGTGLGNILDGRKTGIGLVGILATLLLPIIFPENGADILKSFDLGAPTGAENVEKGKTLLGSIFGAMGTWGILGKIEKWVQSIKK